MATALTATTAFHTRGRRAHDDNAGRSSSTTPSWNTARAAMPAVVGNMWLSASPTVATIERG
jgi:hypothetical protein